TITPNATPVQAITQTSAKIAFDSNESGYAHVHYGLDANYGMITPDSAVVADVDKNIQLSSLTCGRVYHYIISARDTSNNEASTSDANFTTSACTPGDTTPPAVSNIVVTPAQTTASVAFDSNEAGTAKIGYGLTVTHGSVTSYQTMISGSNAIVITGLTCETLYHYSVYAKDGSNNESVSTDANFITEDCTPEDTLAPTITPNATPVQAITQTSAKIAFDSNESGYAHVHYGLDSSYGMVTPDSAVVADADKNIQLSSLTCGSIYHYIISATDAAGNEASTSDANFETAGCTPGDTTPPEFTILQPSTIQTAGDVNIVVEATDETAFDTTYVNNVVIFTVDDVNKISTLTTTGSTATNLKIQLTTSLVAGEYEVVVKIKDSAGNFNQETFNIVVEAAGDTTLPTIDINTINTTSQTATIEADVNDNVSEWLDVYAYVYNADTNALMVSPTRAYRAGTDISYLISDLDANTDFNVTIYVKDAAANIGNDLGTFTTQISTDDVTVPTVDINVTDIASDGATINAIIDDDSNGLLEVWLEYTEVGHSGTYVENPVYFDSNSNISMDLGNLDANTDYNVTLKVKDASGNIGSDSNVFTTLVDTTDVNEPVISDVSVTKHQTTADINFTSDEAGNAKIVYGLSSTYGSSTSYQTMSAGSNEITITGLTCNTEYHYLINARDASNNERITGDANFTTSICTARVTQAPVISSVLVIVGQTTTDINFTSNEAGTAKIGYGLTATHGSLTSYQTMILGTNSIVLTGLACNTLYHYIIYAKDASPNANESVSTDANFITGTCADTTVPLVIQSGPSGIVTNNNPTLFVKLEGIDNNSSTTCKYSTSAFSFATEGTVMTWMSATSRFDVNLTGLTDGTQTYNVICKDVTGNQMTAYPISFNVNTTGNFDYTQALNKNWNTLWLPPTLAEDDSNTTIGHVVGYTSSDYGYLNHWLSATSNWETIYHYDGTNWLVQYRGGINNGIGTLTDMNVALQNPFWIDMNVADRFQLDLVG
ncbi:MAG: hypothetical protein WCF78_01400, partial [archaeon]